MLIGTGTLFISVLAFSFIKIVITRKVIHHYDICKHCFATKIGERNGWVYGKPKDSWVPELFHCLSNRLSLRYTA